jgi:hypothetical protein
LPVLTEIRITSQELHRKNNPKPGAAFSPLTDDLTTGGVKARFLGRVVLVDPAGLGTRAPMQRSGLPATGTFIPQWRCIRRTIRGIPSSQRKVEPWQSMS